MYKNVELKNKISFEELGITTQNSNNHDIRILVKNWINNLYFSINLY